MIKRYFVFSTSIHLAFVLSLIFLTFSSPVFKKQKFYMVDFVSSGASVPETEPLKPSLPSKSLPQNKTSQQSKGGLLVPKNKQSFLPPRKQILIAQVPEQIINTEETVNSNSEPGGDTPSVPTLPTTVASNKNVNSYNTEGLGETNITTDYPNFPFAWYLNIIRVKLGEKWEQFMPRTGNYECKVVFTIKQNGFISGAKIERSSGDTYFDQMAVRSVEYAAPFPALPDKFPEKTLRIHVIFK